MDVRHLLDAAAARGGERPAVVCGADRLTYADLARLVAGIGAALGAAGAHPGDRVAAFFPNCHLYLAAYCAAVGRDLILMPMNLRLAAREVAAILRSGGASLAVGPAATLRDLGLAPAGEHAGCAIGRIEPAGADSPEVPDAALLYFTSGTTGDPKGVILTRGNLESHVALTLEAIDFGPRDTWLHAAPMFHLADAWAIWSATAAGATHAFLGRWEARAAADLVQRAGVTLTNLVPTMIPEFLEAAGPRPAGRPGLRLLMSGGSPIAPSLVGRIEATLGCEYSQTYGLTETSPFLTFSRLEAREGTLPEAERHRRLARTGRAAPGVALRVVRPAASAVFEDVPADDAAVGEVVVRGATVTPGYWRDPDATAEAFRGGWFHTGDLGTLDGSGSLLLVDRAKDVIISGGESVYSIEVEKALLEHSQVREAAVFAVPDERWGEAVRAAAVVVGAPVAPTDLIVFCRARLAAYKCPRAIDLVAELPRTGSGKIDKKALRRPFWAGRTRGIS